VDSPKHTVHCLRARAGYQVHPELLLDSGDNRSILETVLSADRTAVWAPNFMAVVFTPGEMIFLCLFFFYTL